MGKRFQNNLTVGLAPLGTIGKNIRSETLFVTWQRNEHTCDAADTLRFHS
jgi:hypothetical protein